jgi:hypothetical protein
MAIGADVLDMLIPTGGWVIYGDDFDSIIYNDGVKPITKKQFTDGFAEFDAWKAGQDAAQRAAKSALLAKLGITADEAKLLLA